MSDADYERLASECAELTLAGLARAVTEDRCDEEQKGRGFKAVVNLAGGDCYYDEPSIGLNYAFWHHLQRAVGLLQPLLSVLSTYEGRPIKLLDLGHGTGSATTALVALSRHIQVEEPFRLSLIGLDQSEVMLRTARHMLAEPDSNKLRLSIHLRRGSWLDAELLELLADRERDEAAVVLGSFVFDNSDADEARWLVLAQRMARLANAARADDVLLLGGPSKERSTVAVADQLRRGDLAGATYSAVTDRKQIPLRVSCAAPRRRIAALRRNWLLDAVQPGDRGLLERVPPVQDKDVRYTSLRRQPLTLNYAYSEPWPWLVLDERQRRAATMQTSSGPLLIEGAAGSGKSLVLVERAARAFERAPMGRYLITTFNKLMADQLWRWLQRRLAASQLEAGGRDGRYELRRGQSIRILICNRDKLTIHEFQSPPRPARLFDRQAARRRIASMGSTELARWNELLDQEGEGFPDHEMEAFIYGKDVQSFAEYLRLDRQGSGSRLGPRQRRVVWAALMDSGQQTWSHWRKAAYEDRRQQLADPKWRQQPTFDQVFVDEAQDFSQADFTMLNRLVRAPGQLVMAGDPTQAVHLGGTWRPPRLTDASGSATTYAPVQRLDASYRLPWLVVRALQPLAMEVGGNSIPPLPERAAVAGPRPIVVSGGKLPLQLAIDLQRIADVHDVRAIGVSEPTLLGRLRQQPHILGDLELIDANPRFAKGVEFDAMAVSTHAQRFSRDRAKQELYTSLTRSTRALLIVVHPATRPFIGSFLRRMNPKHLMFWDEDARLAWDALASSVL